MCECLYSYCPLDTSKTRNDLCFHGIQWMGMSKVFGQRARSIQNWSLLLKPEEVAKLEPWAGELEQKAQDPQRSPGNTSFSKET
jgi:hypothetical protein